MKQGWVDVLIELGSMVGPLDEGSSIICLEAVSYGMYTLKFL